MKIITLTAWNRPDYLRRTLRSIEKNFNQDKRLVRDEWSLIVSIDPGCREVRQIAKNVDFVPCRVRLNPEPLGINYNCRSAWHMAVDAGADLIVAVEDDTPLSPDALTLCDWFLGLANRNNYGVLNLHGGCDLDNPLQVELTHLFHPWGFAMLPDTFWPLLEGWCRHASLWDDHVQRALAKRGKINLRPALSRSLNIGENGTGLTGRLWRRFFAGQQHNTSVHAEHFYLQPTL